MPPRGSGRSVLTLDAGSPPPRGHPECPPTNVPLQTIMAKTRHRNPRTAMRYIHPSADAVAQVTDELLDLGRHHR
jgi:hypothetical protein